MRTTTAPTLWLTALALAAGPLLARPKKGGSATRETVLSQAELDLSTEVDSKPLPNGGLVWGIPREGPSGAVALVVRAGARQEDIGRSGVALSAAHWVLASFDPAVARAQGVEARLEMLPGGAVFTLYGPAAALPGQFARLVRAALKPDPKLVALARDRALLDTRRMDTARTIGDAVAQACWTGTSLELPAWGMGDVLSAVEDGYEKVFHRTWYQVRGMTAVAVGPGGGAPYSSVLAGAAKGRMARETLAPGEPGLPAHQLQRNPVAVTLAGAALPGPQDAGAALLLRGRLQELVDAAQDRGELSGPALVDIVWTRRSAVVFAAIFHPKADDMEEAVQAAQLKLLERQLVAAADLPEEELNALRKREGARLSRAFADPLTAVAQLASLATVADAPVDVRRAVMATPPEKLRAGLSRAQDPNFHVSVRRSPPKNK